MNEEKFDSKITRVLISSKAVTLKETIEPAGLFETMPQEPWHPGKGAKPDFVIQLN